MKKSSNILKSCFNCSISISILSVLFFSLFMSYAASLNTEKSGSEKIFPSNNENIQDEYNYEYYSHSHDGMSHTPVTGNSSSDSIILSDADDNYNNSELAELTSCSYSKTGLENVDRKYFIIQLVSKGKLPTEKALRSEILLI